MGAPLLVSWWPGAKSGPNPLSSPLTEKVRQRRAGGPPSSGRGQGSPLQATWDRGVKAWEEPQTGGGGSLLPGWSWISLHLPFFPKRWVSTPARQP